MKSTEDSDRTQDLVSHSLGGECGLKSAHDERYKERGKSLPWRGVWVEINIPMGDLLTAPCHSLGGECGLKYRGLRFLL